MFCPVFIFDFWFNLNVRRRPYVTMTLYKYQIQVPNRNISYRKLSTIVMIGANSNPSDRNGV